MPEGEGIIEEDPLFTNYNNWDYSYQEGSPCIDAGDPLDTDPDGSIRDIGAHWYGVDLLGDINNDGVVNVIDIVMVVNYILDGLYNIDGDVNEDGVLNILDIVILTILILGV